MADKDKSVEKVHVFSVNPIEQVVLRAVLNDHFKQEMETLLAQTSAKSLEDLDKSITKFQVMFNYFDSCIEYLPMPSSAKSAKNKMFYLTPKTMRFLADAVNGFRLAKSTIDERYVDSAENVMPSLRAKINISLEHMFTVEEIRKAMQ
jgi:hypothetical protein